MSQKHRGTISIRWLLPLALGFIIIIALVPVITAGYLGARDNTSRLLQANSDAVLDGIEDQLRTIIVPVESQMAQAARFIAASSIDPNERDRFHRFMLGLVTGQTNVSGIGFLERTGPFRRWRCENGEQIIEPRASAWLADDIWADFESGGEARWLPPFVSRVINGPILLHLQPVRREGRLIGVFMTSLTLEAVSEFVMSMNQSITPFVLKGKDTVLVHPNIGRAGMIGEQLPTITSVNDPALARIWLDPREPALKDSKARSRTHWTWMGEGFVARQYTYRDVSSFGPGLWIIGFHQDSRETMRERWVVQGLLYGSGLALLILLLAVWRIGVIASRPGAAIAVAAGHLEALQLDKVANRDILDSRIGEVRQTAHALERAARALQRVQTYIPRALVSRLVTMGDDRSTVADMEVTILFADLAGYTAFAQGRSAAEVGAYLNGLFACMGPIIEAAGGTIDKYTGDGLMAVWGAPTPDPDHARKAVAAALTIHEAMSPLIRETRLADPDGCRLRIGLHSGRVLAGDLGFEGRTDFTVVGRTVNTAQRTQVAMKAMMREDEMVIIGLTEATCERGGLERSELEPAGETATGEPIYRLAPAA